MDKSKFGFITKFWSETVTDFYMQMNGRKNLTVGGCRGISGYSKTEITLILTFGILTVFGNGLLCDSYMNGAVVISGNISGIEFSEVANK